MQYSKPFNTYGYTKYNEKTYNGFCKRFDLSENFPEITGKDFQAYFNFDTEENEKINIKFVLSLVSTTGALKNLEAGISTRLMQMNAWCIFSSLGFYLATSGFSDYALRSPLVEEALAHLDHGKTLKITASNQSV